MLKQVKILAIVYYLVAQLVTEIRIIKSLTKNKQTNKHKIGCLYFSNTVETDKRIN